MNIKLLGTNVIFKVVFQCAVTLAATLFMGHSDELAFAQPPVEAAGAETVNRDATLKAQAGEALKRATSYFRHSVATRGGYVYHYSEDLSRRWGEGEVSSDTIVVQPPATPSVGDCYLRAYEATKDTYFLEAARETAGALIDGQLQSGGWTQEIHFAKPTSGRFGAYRKNPAGRGSWNNSSLDDDQTTAALRLLINVDRAMAFEDAEVREAVQYGLSALLGAQFRNGAFPQVWSGPATSKPFSSSETKRAQLPTYDWRTEGRVKNYWDYYTLNDEIVGNVADVLILADQVYGESKYRDALRRLGDFLMLAQMPEPQPGWCQQYNGEMIPMWARKFEPPAITAWESQDVMKTLVRIAEYSGDKKYLEPIPRALDYFRNKCVLADGRVSRFYELGTDRPLYMDSKYQLTYRDDDLPSHYGWKQPAGFDRIAKAYEAVLRGDVKSRAGAKVGSREAVIAAISQLDDRGRWVSVYTGQRLVGQPKFERGFQYVSSQVFCENVGVLCDYLQD